MLITPRPKLSCLSLLALASLLLTRPAPAQPPNGLDLLRQINSTLTGISEKASSSVVVVSVISKPSAPEEPANDEEDSQFQDVPRDFWRYFHKKNEENSPERNLGQGSGIILRKDGFILTNRHVVEGAESIDVRLKDGRILKAAVRGVDLDSDLAVIKIEATNLPAATFGDSSKSRVGEMVIAIGAPYGLDYTVTFGHLSAKSRSNIVPAYMGGATLDQDFLQTDALINPGNSGGPLLNIEGEVIGVNTLIHGLHTGIGFAVPSNLAREVADHLISEGKFVRSWLGIEIRALREDRTLRESVRGIDDGVLVARILPDGPAFHSDLRVRDIITAVQGNAVATSQELRAQVRSAPPGTPISLDIWRQDKLLKIKVTPAAREEPLQIASRPPRNAETPLLGMKVHLLNEKVANQFGIELAAGVVIISVETNSPAASKGIKPGDVLTRLNGQSITSPADFRTAARKADLQKGVTIELIRDKKSRVETLRAR